MLQVSKNIVYINEKKLFDLSIERWKGGASPMAH